MKRLFIHHPLFRLLSPLFSGIVVYLLILLINNNVSQLQEQFLGEELYVCIGLSFMIQEFSRVLLVVFNRLFKKTPLWTGLLVQVLTSLVLCIVLVTTTIRLYYKNVLGFSPNSEELWVFNSIFCTVTLIYILLHISHQYLYKINTRKLNQELLYKQMVEDDFIQFREGMNPELLFDSFEALIVLIRKQEEEDKIDNLIDDIAGTYRYILSGKERQLVAVEEELEALNQFVHLMNYLPYRTIVIQTSVHSGFLCVPGSILKLLEHIVRRTINSAEIPITLGFSETKEMLEIQYRHNDTINTALTLKAIEDIRRVYGIYSVHEVTLREDEYTRTISIPKLETAPNKKTI